MEQGLLRQIRLLAHERSRGCRRLLPGSDHHPATRRFSALRKNVADHAEGTLATLDDIKSPERKSKMTDLYNEDGFDKQDMLKFGCMCCPTEADDFWKWVYDNYRPDWESRLTGEQIEQYEKRMRECQETCQ